jgi:5-carboxymethyl-2-hydroxymuconate isomerase
MPHLIIEYTDNIAEEPHWQHLYRELHAVLIATGEWYSPDIKSRSIRLTNYSIGNGSPDQAFVSLTLQILSGRSDELKKSVAENCLKVLAGHFHRTLEMLQASVTVQIVDIHRPSYTRRISYEI